MSGCLAWNNVAALDTSGVAVSGSGFDSHAIDSAYPALRCLNDDPSDVTRVDYDVSTSSTTSVLTADWGGKGGAQTVRVVAALNCRFSADVTSVNALVLDTGGSTLATGTSYAAAAMVPIPGTEDRYDLYWLFPATYSAGRVALHVALAANAADYYEVGCLRACNALVWDGGAGYDWELSGDDMSGQWRGPGGGASVYPLPTLAVASLGKQALEYAESFGDSSDSSALSMRSFMFDCGRGSPVIAISTDADQHKLQTMSVYGLVEQMPSLRNVGRFRFGTSLTVKQWR